MRSKNYSSKTGLRIFWGSLLLILSFTESYSQTIIGNIYDLSTRKPIPDVIILLKPSLDKISAIQTSDEE
ncbi:MAG: hypothetical protein KGZ42_09460 [Melioribacter sp.]|nr:hypothetical protein [Melioribacter sp.]